VWYIVLRGRGQTPANQLLGQRSVDAKFGVPAGRGQMAMRELLRKILLGSITPGAPSVISAFQILFGEIQQGL